MKIWLAGVLAASPAAPGRLWARFAPAHFADEADCELWIRACWRREPLTRGRHVRQVLQHPAAVCFLLREHRDCLHPWRLGRGNPASRFRAEATEDHGPRQDGRFAGDVAYTGDRQAASLRARLGREPSADQGRYTASKRASGAMRARLSVRWSPASE